ncbi:MAG: DUF6079 family protein [Myxococcales bacterium]|nr:DUF6079 family protein [Myxococcales bacterium]
MAEQPPIREIVDVRSRPTVVRLEEAADQAWIRESYCLTGDAKQHLAQLRAALAREHGVGGFVIGQYGSGKSHLLAYLKQALSAGELCAHPPRVCTLSLLNHPASRSLEAVVSEALGMAVPDMDRRPQWDARLAAEPDGLLLIIDELSEFLRSKESRAAFNEDIRFLQFLGELGQDRRLFVLAAVQEAIEHIGELEHGHYRKIKDRYPLRLQLSTTHVRELIADSILQKKPGYEAAVRQLIERLDSALPQARQRFAELREIYPVHPATLELLEAVRDRFSQTRGIVDFVSRRLGGDPTAGIDALLERPMGTLLTPDAIVEHFRDLLELQAEFAPLSQHLLPYYGRHLAALFERPARRQLATRVLNLLILCHLIPSRRGLSAQEAADWLLFAATRVDPGRNVQVIEGVLSELATRGRYIKREGDHYRLDLDDDASEQLSRLLRHELAELQEGDGAFAPIAEALASGDGGSDFNPLALPQEQTQGRQLMWSQHERPWVLYVGQEDPGPQKQPTVVLRLPWGQNDAVAGCTSILPEPLEADGEVRELCALLRIRDRAVPPNVDALCKRRIADLASRLLSRIRSAYARARLITPSGAAESCPPLGVGQSLRAWLDAIALGSYRRLYPAFERFAPQCGPLTQESYRELMRFADAHDLGHPSDSQWVQMAREGYLVPMKLLTRSGRSYRPARQLARHDLARLVLSQLGHEPSIDSVYKSLAGPVYGLVPDQIHLLLLTLLLAGEIDIVKGDRCYRELYETLPSPRSYDRVVAGRSLPADQHRTLERICETFSIPLGKDFSASAEHHAIAELSQRLAASVMAIDRIAPRLEGPGGADSQLGEKIAELRELSDGLQDAGDPLDAFEAFAHRIGSAGRFLALYQELDELPERVVRYADELERLGHLLDQEPMRELATDLGPPPGLGDAGALGAYIKRARDAIEAHKQRYLKAHEAYYAQAENDAAWRWSRPALAESQSLALNELLRSEAEALAAARHLRCGAVQGNLNYQSRCRCGYDAGSDSAPLGPALHKLAALRQRIEQEVRDFFAQAEVRKRVESWVDKGIETGAHCRAYLAGRAPYPDVDDVAAFDEHLRGVELLRQVSIDELGDLLGSQPWSPAALQQTLRDFVDGLEGHRIRFEPAPRRAPEAVARFCIEQTLRHGLRAPAGLGDCESIAEEITPAWVGPLALQKLDTLALPEACERAVLGLVISGQLSAEAGADGPCASVRAAAHLSRPETPSTPAKLAELTELLYGQHDALWKLGSTQWLAALDALALSRLSPELPRIDRAVQQSGIGQWLVIDALGLPSLRLVRELCAEMLPEYSLESVGFARAAERTTTEQFYRDLIDSGVRHGFTKLDALDKLLHQAPPRFEDFIELGRARLRREFEGARSKLDTSVPLLVFGDHGFRMREDGRGYQHGGGSTLERVIPVLELRPR